MSLEAKANTGSGTDLLNTDLVGGVHTPYSKIDVGGPGTNVPLSSVNPLPAAITNLDQGIPILQNLAEVGAANPLHVQGNVAAETLVNGNFVSELNPMPTKDGRQDTPIVVQSASFIDSNLLLETAGVAYFDVQGYNTISCVMDAGAGVTAGAITVEGSNSSTGGFLPVPLAYEILGDTGSRLSIGPIAVPANTQLAIVFPVTTRYVRVRVSTAFVGGGLVCRSKLSQAANMVRNFGAVNTSFAEGVPMTSTALSALDVNLLTGTSGVGAWVLTYGASEIVYQVVASAGISAGAIFLEGTNDNTSTTGIALPYEEVNSITATRANTAVTIAANANRIFKGSLPCRYVRLRISTAFVGGTVGVRAHLKQAPTAVPSVLAVNSTAQGTSSVSIAAAVLGISPAVSDASAARTASGTGATIANNVGRGIIVYHNVTAVSGTSPSMVLRMQVQDPVSSAWADLPGVTFPARTATGLYISTVYPGLTTTTVDKLDAAVPRAFRFAWTIAGTTPSLTSSIAVGQCL